MTRQSIAWKRVILLMNPFVIIKYGMSIKRQGKGRQFAPETSERSMKMGQGVGKVEADPSPFFC